ERRREGAAMRTVLIASAVLLAAFAPAPLPRPDRGRAERDRLLGTWVLKQVRHAGDTNWKGVRVGPDAVYLSEEVTISEREMLIHNRNPKARRSQRWMEIQIQRGMQHVDFLHSPGGRTL